MESAFDMRRLAARPADSELPLRSLQALQSHVAVLDHHGRIVFVNEAWTFFARANGADPAAMSETENYLDVCRAAARDDPHAASALMGIEAILSGALPQFTMEYPCHSPDQPRWFVMTVAPLEVSGARGAVVSHLNITLIKAAAQALEASEQRFRAMFENAAVGMAEIAPDGMCVRVNGRFRQITGRGTDEARPLDYHAITHADDRDADATQMAIMRSGAINSYTLEKRIYRPDGPDIWVNTTVSCVRNADGTIAHFIAVLDDVSERRLAEQRQKTLLRELAHRGKNLLAVIQSIARRSLSGPQTLDEARTAFTGRLQAMSQTYGILVDESFDGVLLDTLLSNELSAHGARARLEGPKLVLTVKAAQTFALIVHELATNAAKYGALSVPEGRLSVSWKVTTAGDERLLEFAWHETDGPPASTPARRGFGTTLISTIAGAEFGCVPELTYGAEGFHYRFAAPLPRLGAVLADSPVRRRLKTPMVCALYDAWARLRGPDGTPPPLNAFDWTHFAATGWLTIATVEPDRTVRFVQVGRALVDEMGRPLHEQDMSQEEGLNLVSAYRRCAERAEPTHELLRFDFGGGEKLTFERLLVPFSASPGSAVTHVAGIAVYDGPTQSSDAAAITSL